MSYLQECSNVLSEEILREVSMADFVVGVAEPDKLYVYVYSKRVERTIRNLVGQYLNSVAPYEDRIFIEVKLSSGRPTPAIF